MPELPEVEIHRRNLARWTAGCRVAAVRIEDVGVVRPTWSTRPSDAVGDPVAALDPMVGEVAGPFTRHGKRLGWRVGPLGLGLHLGMTGRWVRRPEGAAPRHARLGIVLDDGHALWFIDPRRFGCVVPVPAKALPGLLSDGLGPDALDAAPAGEDLAAWLTGRRAIHTALLDQARLAGVGNIQAQEALWRAGVDPRARCDALDPDAWGRLALGLRDTLEATLAHTAADDVVYLSGGADNPFDVYGRAGEPCPRCGAVLSGGRIGGRTVAWCPACQPSP